jgi:brefeldin A-inhibited guanine nucleotide-exchange protein
VGPSAADAARFLHATPSLSKTAVGELLGEHAEEHLAIMHAYVDAVDLTHTPHFDQVHAPVLLIWEAR